MTIRVIIVAVEKPVDLDIQHEQRGRPITLSYVAWLLETRYLKKMCLDFLYTFCLKNF